MMLTLETVALTWILNPNADSNHSNIRPYPQNGSGIIPWYYTTGIIPQLYKHIYRTDTCRVTVVWTYGRFWTNPEFWCNHDWIVVKTLSRGRMADVTPRHSFCTRVCWVAAVHQCSWDTPITLNRHISSSISPILLIFGQWINQTSREGTMVRISTAQHVQNMQKRFFTSKNSSSSELWMASYTPVRSDLTLLETQEISMMDEDEWREPRWVAKWRISGFKRG
jgi:hypothetical protein